MTDLSEADMQQLPSPPDLVRQSVTQLTLGDLTGLQYTQAAQAAAAAQQTAGAP